MNTARVTMKETTPSQILRTGPFVHSDLHQTDFMDFRLIIAVSKL